VKLIAHRGFADAYPENTVLAVAEASSRADTVEVDVRRCGSGELVVIHDEDVDRVTDGTGAVADHTATELAALDVLGSGEGVPTLERVLDAVPEGVEVNIELKELDTAADALAADDTAGTETVVSSFRPAALAQCRRADGAVPLALLFAAEPGANLALARELDCEYVHPHQSVAGRVVEPAHGDGVGVNAWTVDDRATAERLAALGCDGVIADHPGVWPAERRS